jgi:hypothetical protein
MPQHAIDPRCPMCTLSCNGGRGGVLSEIMVASRERGKLHPMPSKKR